ncbi:hypothetical protein D3C74_462580 [compost metagenome]
MVLCPLNKAFDIRDIPAHLGQRLSLDTDLLNGGGLDGVFDMEQFPFNLPQPICLD